MSEDRSPVATMIDAHEEWLRRMDSMATKTRRLSAVTVLVAVLLALGFAVQMALPLFGLQSVTVNLADPALVAFQAILLFLVLIWMYTGLRFYAFTTRLTKQVSKAREEEAELERRITK